MERRLIVMRHAKSSHDDRSLSDHQRPLNDRGWREAEEIAQRLVEEGWQPEQVVSSDSTRTRQTWEAMEPYFKPRPQVVWDEELYLSGVGAVYQALTEVPDAITDVLVLGHNPGWEAVVGYFSGEEHTMTTSNAALLLGEGDTWEEAAQANSFDLVKILRPRK